MQIIIKKTTCDFVLFLLLAFVASAEETTRSPVVSLDLGGFYCLKFKKNGINLVTGARQNSTVPEFGFALGTRYHFNKAHSIGIWGDIGIGDFSMVMISHLTFGVDYLYGNKTDSWAIGLLIGGGSLGAVLGFEAFFRNFYIKPGFGYYYDKYDNYRILAAKVTVGYSISF